MFFAVALLIPDAQQVITGLLILNIATVRDENFNKPDWDKLASLGDYIILTDPAVKKTF